MPKWVWLIILAGATIISWMFWSYDPLEKTNNSQTRTQDENYPAYLPKNFKDAPQKIECKLAEGNKPFAKFYRNAAGKWSLVILGKNEQDNYIYFQKTLSGEEGDGESINEWIWNEKYGWVNIEKFSETEKGAYSGGWFLFDRQEKQFIIDCYKRAGGAR